MFIAGRTGSGPQLPREDKLLPELPAEDPPSASGSDPARGVPNRVITQANL